MFALEILERLIRAFHAVDRKGRIVGELFCLLVFGQHFIADITADADDGDPEQIPQSAVNKADQRKREHSQQDQTERD